MPKSAVVMSKPTTKESAVIAKGAAAPSSTVQVSVYITPDVLDRLETARKSNANLVLSRTQWLSMAVLEKLAKDGF